MWVQALFILILLLSVGSTKPPHEKAEIIIQCDKSGIESFNVIKSKELKSSNSIFCCFFSYAYQPHDPSIPLVTQYFPSATDRIQG